MVILTLLFNCNVQEKRISFEGWERDLARAFEVAKKEGKKIFIYFRARWCSWCLEYEKVLFNRNIISFLKDNFVLVVLDADRDRSLFLQYRGRGTPFTVIVDARGRPVVRFHGTLSAKDLVDVLLIALEGRAKPSEVRIAFRLGKDLLASFSELEKLFVKDLMERFDPIFGGFSSPTGEGVVFKWPTPLTYTYLLKRGILKKEVLFSLNKDLEYLFDRVDQGFFNFFDRTRSFDFYFETSKSLQVNGLMILALVTAYRITGDETYLGRAVQTFNYLEKNLLDRNSGCYLNAQFSDPSYYNAPPSRRLSMKPPPADTALVVEYNSLAFLGLYELYRIKGIPDILARIETCTDFILKRMVRERTLFRYYDIKDKVFGLPNFRRDRVFFGLALSTVFGGSKKYKEVALHFASGGSGVDDWVVKSARALLYLRLGEKRRAISELEDLEVNLGYHNPEDMYFLLEALRVLSELR